MHKSFLPLLLHRIMQSCFHTGWKAFDGKVWSVLPNFIPACGSISLNISPPLVCHSPIFVPMHLFHPLIFIFVLISHQYSQRFGYSGCMYLISTAHFDWFSFVVGYRICPLTSPISNGHIIAGCLAKHPHRYSKRLTDYNVRFIYPCIRIFWCIIIIHPDSWRHIPAWMLTE